MLYHNKRRGVKVLLAPFVLLVEDAFARIFISFNHGSDSGRKQAGWTLTRDVIGSLRSAAIRPGVQFCRRIPSTMGCSRRHRGCCLKAKHDAAVRNSRRYRKSTAGRYPSARRTIGADTVNAAALSQPKAECCQSPSDRPEVKITDGVSLESCVAETSHDYPLSEIIVAGYPSQLCDDHRHNLLTDY